MQHSFGGNWTTDKIERVRKYLAAYMQIMKDRNFSVAYIDAFAGTGYVNNKQKMVRSLFPEFAESEVQDFIKGSARVALEIQPPFNKYIFIEKDKKHFDELQKLKEEFPPLADKIVPINADANDYIINLCKRDWTRHRAVMFLDPYGMQVNWETIEAIASTQAIDLWILFPLGVAVNRLLKRNGDIRAGRKKRLDSIFGDSNWYEAFYRKDENLNLFSALESGTGEGKTSWTKTANFKSIGEYYNKRLASIFPKVAPNPLPLVSSSNNPLYLLCFAAANPRAADTAVKIAKDILKKP
jgi:three-Cys-motif partner protein